MGVTVNYLAVFVAALVSMALGFLWYGQLFGKQWMRLKGYTKEDLKKEQKQMGKYYGLSFILAIVTAYILSHVMTLSQNFFNQSGFSTGLTSAFWMWVGFIMPVQATATIFGNKNWKLFGIDTGYQFVSILSMGVAIGLLG